MDLDWDTLTNGWQEMLNAVRRLGGDASDLVVEGPASEKDVTAVEKELNAPFPPDLRALLVTYSKRVGFHWYLPDEMALPDAIRTVTFGSFDWSLEEIYKAEIWRREFVDEVLSERDDPAIPASWQERPAFHNICNGDFLAVDLTVPDRTPVVYLNHDDDPAIHGYHLGADLGDFLHRWTALGCPGPESWLLEPFSKNLTEFLDPNCANAILWRKTLELDI